MKAFKKLFGAEIKEALPEDKKDLKSFNLKLAESFEKITKKQDEAVTKFILKDKERYEKERFEYNKKGYYTLEDGTRSTELAKKKSMAKDAKDSKGTKDGKDSTKKSVPKKVK